jgi:hypothetical protein
MRQQPLSWASLHERSHSIFCQPSDEGHEVTLPNEAYTAFPHPIRYRPHTKEQKAEGPGVVLLLIQQLVPPILFPESDIASREREK